MFLIEDTPTFTHTVEVERPTDAGKKKESLKVTFAVIDDEEIEAMDLLSVEGAKDFLRRVVVSMDDIVDPDKNPVPYSSDLRERMLALRYVRTALMGAYGKAVSGAKVGN